MTGPSVPGRIVRAVVGRVLFFGWLLACRLGLDGVEQLVQILPVVDQAHALVDSGEAWRPVGLPGAALDADIGHGLLLGEAALHDGKPSQVRPSRRRPAAFLPTRYIG